MLPRRFKITFERFGLMENEENWFAHVGVLVEIQQYGDHPGISRFHWNGYGCEVDEGDDRKARWYSMYPLGQDPEDPHADGLFEAWSTPDPALAGLGRAYQVPYHIEVGRDYLIEKGYERGQGNAFIIDQTGRIRITAHAWADEDKIWPGCSSSQDNGDLNCIGADNDLGSSDHWIDSGESPWYGFDPNSMTNRTTIETIQTRTDKGNYGFILTFKIEQEPMPPPPTTLTIEGIVVTQGVQKTRRFLDGLPVPKREKLDFHLVTHRPTLVRVLLDSGLRNSSGGILHNVTGSLDVLDSSENLVCHIDKPIPPTIDARPYSAVDDCDLNQSLNFVIAGNCCDGKRLIIATAWAPGLQPIKSPIEEVTFGVVPQLDVMVMRMKTDQIAELSRQDAELAIAQIARVYPIARMPSAGGVDGMTDEGLKIEHYWKVMPIKHNLTTEEGMEDLLDELEDLQECEWRGDSLKLFAVIPPNVDMNRKGTSLRSDNVAFSCPGFYSVTHELGHLYGLEHAAGCGAETPVDVDDGMIINVGAYVPLVDNNHILQIDPIKDIVLFPPDTYDLMSYCTGVTPDKHFDCWIGEFHWSKLYRNLGGQL